MEESCLVKGNLVCELKVFHSGKIILLDDNLFREVITLGSHGCFSNYWLSLLMHSSSTVFLKETIVLMVYSR